MHTFSLIAAAALALVSSVALASESPLGGKSCIGPFNHSRQPHISGAIGLVFSENARSVHTTVQMGVAANKNPPQNLPFATDGGESTVQLTEKGIKFTTKSGIVHDLIFDPQTSKLFSTNSSQYAVSATCR